MILIRLVWFFSSVTQSEAKLHLFEVALNIGIPGCRKMAIKFFALVFPKTYWKVLVLPDFFPQMVIFYHNTTLIIRLFNFSKFTYEMWNMDFANTIFGRFLIQAFKHFQGPDPKKTTKKMNLGLKIQAHHLIEFVANNSITEYGK